MLDIIQKAASRVGGIKLLATKLGITPQAIYQWAEVPLDRAADIERISGIPRSRLRPDVFQNSIVPGIDNGSQYDQDYFAWLDDQVNHLAAGRFSSLDLNNLIDEIRDLGRAEKREIQSRLGVLLIHLLKWWRQPEKRSGSWRATMIEQRARILKRLQESPSLRNFPGEILEEEYHLARASAAAETDLNESVFPKNCPFTIDQVLDPDFLP
jgi:DNA-binding transcriptional regulator YdaS (Cro superfamily)